MISIEGLNDGHLVNLSCFHLDLYIITNLNVNTTLLSKVIYYLIFFQSKDESNKPIQAAVEELTVWLFFKLVKFKQIRLPFFA